MRLENKMNIPVVDFGKLIYKEHEGKSTYVYSYCEVEIGDFLCYGTNLTNFGYCEKSS